jgi:hypothetical protein
VSPWLAASYGALALGLAWSITGTASWRRRVPYIVCAPPLALALWLGRPDPAGWPSSSRAPKLSQLVWAQIDEPDPAVSDPGHVYLWLDVGDTAPRAYVLPYSRRLHEQVQRALKAVKQGRPIGVTSAVTGRGHGQRIPGHRPDRIRFFPHPPIVLPPKTH